MFAVCSLWSRWRHTIRHTKSGYKYIDNGYQEYSNNSVIIDFICTANLISIFHVVATVQNETNTNADLQ